MKSNFHSRLVDNIIILLLQLYLDPPFRQTVTIGRIAAISAGFIHQSAAVPRIPQIAVSYIVSDKNYCMYRKTCHQRRACERKCDKKLCKFCKILKDNKDCRSVCSDYVRPYCEILESSPYVCNGCPDFAKCPQEKRVYNYRTADELYKAKQKDRSTGFNLTKEEFSELNKKISPLIKNGHSPYAAIQEVKDSGISLSTATLFRIIDSGVLDAKNIDFSEKLRRHRPKTKRKS